MDPVALATSSPSRHAPLALPSSPDVVRTRQPAYGQDAPLRRPNRHSNIVLQTCIGWTGSTRAELNSDGRRRRPKQSEGWPGS
eukprot:9227366-Alexandrium_andersonii.AAC.1